MGAEGPQILTDKHQAGNAGPGAETGASCQANCLLHGAEAIGNVGTGTKLLLPEVLQGDQGRAGRGGPLAAAAQALLHPWLGRTQSRGACRSSVRTLGFALCTDGKLKGLKKTPEGK